jgi:hypothetical protein
VLRYGQLYGPGTGNVDARSVELPLHVEAAAWAAVLALEKEAVGVRFTQGIWRRYLRHQTFRLTTVNGEAGLVAFVDGQPSWVLTIETDGARILAAYAVVNPDKLAGIAPLPALPTA